jgi:hypothetical protein
MGGVAYGVVAADVMAGAEYAISHGQVVALRVAELH